MASSSKQRKQHGAVAHQRGVKRHGSINVISSGGNKT